MNKLVVTTYTQKILGLKKMTPPSNRKTSLSKSGIKSSHNYFFSKTCKLSGAVVALSRKHNKKYSLSTSLPGNKSHQPSKFNKKS